MIPKVLVIDDSKTTRTIVRSSLMDEDIGLVFAASGAEGITLAQSDSPPDLILLDIELPESNGFEVCQRLKADERTAKIPVIFLTGASSTTQKIRGLDLGAIDYVTKPFDPAELCARVRASLRGKYMFDLLAQKAMLDGLTGLWNRAYFDQRLADAVEVARSAGQPLTLVMVDVDRFKSINDSQGHPFGDTVLRHVAKALTDCARKDDAVCRYGGEEFGVLLPGVRLSSAVLAAERIRAAVEGLNLHHRNQTLRITCSLGVASYRGGTPEQLVAAADAALYLAKKQGRNRVVCADETHAPGATAA